MAIRLKTKMAITHGLVALITVFLVVVASYLLINERFMDYVVTKHFKEHKKIVEDYQKSYQDGQWKNQQLENLGLAALKEGYLITVTDVSGGTLWEPGREDRANYQRTLKEIEKKIIAHFGTPGQGMQTKSYALIASGKPIGTLNISYYSSYFLTEHDLMFLKYLHNSLFWVAGIAFLISLGLSNVISSGISSQIARIIQSAKDMAKGEALEKGIIMDSQVLEINELAQSLDFLQESLREKEASNKRLSADIAHELRTPISTLQSHLEAMMEGVWQPTQDRLVSCHEEIIRMAALVNDLEKLNKYDTGQISLNHTSFDLTELVRNIYTNFQGQFYKKSIQCKFQGENCMVIADREKMGQVMVNLMANSLKYTPEGGRVFINIAGDRDHAYIVINDNGIGISEADLPKIFNRLYRADVSRTRATGGAGIGLAVAKAIVEAHQGQIVVVSQQGKGTEFTVVIPKKI